MSTKGSGRRDRGAIAEQPRAFADAEPGGRQQLVRAKRVEVPMTFQSVSEKSPPSSE